MVKRGRQAVGNGEGAFIFRKDTKKMCIYTTYIYSKRHKSARVRRLSYGYPMVMVWLSYGISTKLVRNWQERGKKPHPSPLLKRGRKGTPDSIRQNKHRDR